MPASEAAARESLNRRGGPVRTPGFLSAPVLGAHPHSPAITFALAAAHALLFAAAFPPAGLWPLALVCIVPLAWLALRARSTTGALASVFVTQLVMWLWIHRWMFGITVAGYPAFSLYLSLFPVLFAWIIRRAARTERLSAWPMTLLVPIAWVGVECLRGELAFNGYPWFLAGHPLVEMPVLAQSADLLGAYFVSFLAAMCSGALVDLGACAGSARSRRCVLPWPGVALVMWGANIGYGAWRMQQADVSIPGPRVLVIQTNLPQDNKKAWAPEQQVADFMSFRDQTEQAFQEASRQGSIDLIAWPETMLPGRGLDEATVRVQTDVKDFGAWFVGPITQLQRRLGVPMVVGSAAYEGLHLNERDQWRWDRHFNSVYLIQGVPPYQRYDKNFLTPFGETMPYISTWPWLEQKLLDLGAEGMKFDLDSSPELQVLELRRSDGNVVRLATPICFEDTVGRVVRRMIYERGRKRADAIINLSNDGWFGEFDSGREQHAQIARFRCIENRVPMIRTVNTGCSVAIDSRGKITERIGAGRYGSGRRNGWIAADVNLDRRSTLYGLVGDGWAWLCLAFTAIMLVRTMMKSRPAPAMNEQ